MPGLSHSPRKIKTLPNFRKSVGPTKVELYLYIQRSTDEIQIPQHWNLAAWPPRRLCYRPAVFFRNLRVIALSLPQGITRRAFQKVFLFQIFYFSKTVLSLNPRNLELRKSGIVCIW
jgi:hypothetical protein